jgi:hypothetical protein
MLTTSGGIVEAVLRAPRRKSHAQIKNNPITVTKAATMVVSDSQGRPKLGSERAAEAGSRCDWESRREVVGAASRRSTFDEVAELA